MISDEHGTCEGARLHANVDVPMSKTNGHGLGASDSTSKSGRVQSVTDRLDAVSKALSRAGGMAIAAGQVDIVNVIGEAGCDLDDIINDLLEAEDA